MGTSRWLRGALLAAGGVAFVLTLSGCGPTPGSFTVNTTVDGADAHPGDGKCEVHTGSGDCSLRAAVTEVNAAAVDGDITVPSGMYALTVSGSDDANASGDLDVTSTHKVVIHAPQPGAAIVGTGADGVIDVFGPNVTLLGIATKGSTGPGVRVRAGAKLLLSAGASTGNGGAGVAVDVGGSADLRNVTLSGNAGGGLVDGGTATGSFVTVAANATGGVSGAGATTLSASVVAGQTSGANCTPSVSSGGGNLSSDASCAFAASGDVISTPAALAPLSGALLPVHQPLLGSPVLDAIAIGTPLCTAPPADQRGVTRPIAQGCDRGAVEADFAVSLTVNTTTDAPDANPGDGLCATAAAQCSLRAAIDETNARPVTSGHTIALAADPTLSIAGQGDDADATGDLDVATPVSLHGAGHVVAGGGLDRVFDLRASSRHVRMDNVTIRGGSTSAFGGGILDASGDLVLDQVTLANNVAVAGGGVYSTSPSLDIRRSTITGNTGSIGGGGILGEHQVLVSSSTITGNQADVTAGAIHPGALLADSGSISASTIGANQGTSNLGLSGSGTLTVKGTIIEAGTSGAACEVYRSTGIVSGGWNLVGDSTCRLSTATDHEGVPSLLGPLAANGGPTRTQLASSSSVAVGAIPVGTAGLCDAAAPIDQRGIARPQGAACDIGSVEGAGPAQNGLSLTVTTASDALDVSPGDGVCAIAAGGCSLRAAITETNLTPAADVITIAAGINPTLSRPGAGEDGNATGDLDVTGYLTIDGGGATVSGAGLDRVIDVSHGGLRVLRTTVTGGVAASSAFTNLTYDGTGGGIQASVADLVLDRSTIIGNTTPALPQSGAGGAVALRAGGLRIIDSTIDGNSARDGAALFVATAVVRIDRSTLSGNRAVNGGKGVISDSFADGGDDIRISASTFATNDAGNGGVLQVFGSKVDVRSTTLIDNAGTFVFFGGAIHVTSSVIRAPITALCTSVVSGGWNVASTQACNLTTTGDQQAVSLVFGPLAANGGPTKTYLPAANSVAVDHIPFGTAGVCDASTPVDQRGVARPVGPGCDAGAVEGSGPPVAPLSLLVNTTADTRDATPGNGVCVDAVGTCSLRAAIDEANVWPTADTITIAPGVNPVRTLRGGDDTNAAGDLDVFDQLTIVGNGAVVDAGGIDRVLDIHQTSVSISGVNFNHGTALSTDFLTVYGGGIRLQGNLSLTDSSVFNSRANGLYATGGGIYVSDNSSLSLTRVRITGNKIVSTQSPADGGAGVFAGANSSVSITASAITGNQTNQSGGAIFGSGVSLVVRNSTISGNTAAISGSALHLIGQPYPTSATIIASTIAGNTNGSASGQAIAYGRVTLTLSGNVLQSAGSVLCAALEVAPPVVSGGWNVADDASCGLTATGDLQTNTTLLGPLASNGGPTPTQLPPVGHPAIDRIPIGTAGLCDGTMPTDQRGFPRPVGSGCDSGAVER